MEKIKNNHAYIAAFLAFCLLIIQRFLPGAGYYPVIDDWFLYGDLCEDIWTQHIIPNQKFAVRPMAGLFDTFIAAPLFKHMWAVKLLLCVMLFAAAVMLHRVMKKNKFAMGGTVFLIVCLLPLNMEATYWIAAAIRSVCALFFISLAAMLLSDYCETKKAGYLIGYIVTGFAAVGFCEQAIPIYLFLCVYIILKHGDKRLLIIPTVHLIAIGVYYACNRSSAELAARGQLLTSGIMKHTKDITVAASQIMGRLNLRMLAWGFSDGVEVMLGGAAFMFVIVAVLSAAFGYFASAAHCKADKFSLKRAAVGIVTALAGIAVFYVISDTRFTIRSVFFFTIGASIVAGELLLLIPVAVRKWICIIGFSCTAFVFTVSGIGIVNQFNTVSRHDSEIVSNIIKADTEGDLSNLDKCSYLLDTYTYYPDVSSVECWDSIRAGCSNYADITGCMRHAINTVETNNLMPLRNGESMNFWDNISAGRSRFFALMPNLGVIRVSEVPDGDGYMLIKDDGELYGRLIPDGDMYRFEKSEADVQWDGGSRTVIITE